MDGENLMRLASLLGMASRPSKGYRIAEGGKPEVVTAEGAYYPFEKGEVIPLESRERGGNVSPSQDKEQQKLDILKQITSSIKVNPNLHLESRQAGGEVSPIDQIEKSKYDIFKAVVGALKPQPVKPQSPTSPSSPSTSSLPGLPKPTTASSYGLMPDSFKPGEGEALWRKNTGPLEDLLKNKRPTTMDLTSRQAGGPVNPQEDEEEKLRRMIIELNAPKDQGPMGGIPRRWSFEDPEAVKRLESSMISSVSNTPEGQELEARRKWAIPGYPEERLENARKIIGPALRGEKLLGVRPGYEKSYYEAHPEEKIADEEEARMKPIRDAILKQMEREETRQQGYGLGFGPTPNELRLGHGRGRETPSQMPELIQGLKGLTTTTAKTTGLGTPHLVQTESGQYAWTYPPSVTQPKGAVLPAGISGKKPTIEGFEEWKRMPENKGKTYEDYRKWEMDLKDKEVATSGLREFEIATGTDPSKRGTPEYSKSYMEFLGGKKQATTDPIQQKKLGTTLRKEFNSLQPVKDYRDIETRFNIMGKAIEESKTTKNFVAVDQALITIFNKMTDPQSVVRESEYLRTPQDLALWNRIKGKVSKMAAGGAGLTPDDRNALFSMAQQFQVAYKSKFDQLRNEYRGYAVDYGLDPETVIKSQKNIMSEEEARKALEEKGIVGNEQDTWIETYKKAGKIE
jgi:hypothetical protein